MRVPVDEARSQHAIARVDDAIGAGAREVAHGRDAPILHRHVGAEPRVARAVHHPRVAHDQVIVGGMETNGGKTNQQYAHGRLFQD